jgi:LPS O-antigen subunit length determinant protein (WzzB/FepE family)
MLTAFKDPNREHFAYFETLSIIGISIAALLIALASFAISKKQYKEGAMIIVYAAIYIMSYFQNRLLYAICNKYITS